MDQQLGLVLAKAREKGHFLPWGLVFADAAISGTTSDRAGYRLAKRALGVEGLAAMYIDEIGRASRDNVETLRLGRLVARTGKRLIGVSDGFDSDNAASKMMLSIFGMVHECFVDQLQSKVHRVMDDAFERGRTSTRRPSGISSSPPSAPMARA